MKATDRSILAGLVILGLLGLLLVHAARAKARAGVKLETRRSSTSRARCPSRSSSRQAAEAAQEDYGGTTRA